MQVILCYKNKLTAFCTFNYYGRVLLRSRETKPNKYDGKMSDVVEQLRLQSLQKATVIQWLCFSPPSTIRDFEIINAKLLTRALLHRWSLSLTDQAFTSRAHCFFFVKNLLSTFSEHRHALELKSTIFDFDIIFSSSATYYSGSLH